MTTYTLRLRFTTNQQKKKKASGKMANGGRLLCKVLLNVKIYLNHTAILSPIGNVNMYTLFSVPFEALGFCFLASDYTPRAIFVISQPSISKRNRSPCHFGRLSDEVISASVKTAQRCFTIK